MTVLSIFCLSLSELRWNLIGARTFATLPHNIATDLAEIVTQNGRFLGIHYDQRIQSGSAKRQN